MDHAAKTSLVFQNNTTERHGAERIIYSAQTFDKIYVLVEQ